MPRQIIIGDIHGCEHELCELLDAVSPVEGDEIIAVGDLVNRGPRPEAVLRFFRDEPAARSVMGNVEHGHTGWRLTDDTKAKPAYILTRRALAERYDEWVDFMAALPLVIETPDALVVHGAWEPGVERADQRMAVLLGLADGETHLQGRLGEPWYDLYDGPKPLVVGHHDYDKMRTPLIRDGRVYGIDTGCVYGGCLTALVLPDFRIVSVDAREDYWRAQRALL
ncbi:MAG: metallophosphoesterase [Phycisphaerae bacterium]|nr:metallophosphoesterase [Phycisphaerae bacterium]